MSGDFVGFKSDEASNDRALSAVHAWYDTGSSLYNSARILIGLTDLREFKTDYVGEPVAANISDDKMIGGHRDRVSDMLIGMAIEAWLKGLIVAAGPIEDRTLRLRVSELIDDHLSKDPESEVSFSRIFDAMDTPKIQTLIAQIDAAQQEVARERVAILSMHHHHDLVRMASAVGFEPALSDDQVKALRYYSQMIELGRYPAPKKPRNLVYVKNRVTLDSARNKLFSRIHEEFHRRGGFLE